MRIARLGTPLLVAAALVLVAQPPAQAAAKPAPAKLTDLRVSISGPSAVDVGAEITYTISVLNAGPAGTPNTRLTVDLGSTSFRSTTGYCSGDYGQVSCQLGAIPSGGTEAVTIHAKADDIGTSNSSATTWSDEMADSNTANNTASMATTVVDHPRVETRTYPEAWFGPCTGCSQSVVWGSYYTTHYSAQVVAMDGSLVSGGRVYFEHCSAPVTDGHASCSYNGTYPTVRTSAYYDGSATYAPSNGSV